MSRHKMDIVAEPRGDGTYVVVDGPKPTIGRTLRVEDTRGVFSEVVPLGGLQEEQLFGDELDDVTEQETRLETEEPTTYADDPF